jgi:hypothetical protein
MSWVGWPARYRWNVAPMAAAASPEDRIQTAPDPH